MRGPSYDTILGVGVRSRERSELSSELLLVLTLCLFKGSFLSETELFSPPSNVITIVTIHRLVHTLFAPSIDRYPPAPFFLTWFPARHTEQSDAESVIECGKGRVPANFFPAKTSRQCDDRKRSSVFRRSPIFAPKYSSKPLTDQTLHGLLHV